MNTNTLMVARASSAASVARAPSDSTPASSTPAAGVQSGPLRATVLRELNVKFGGTAVETVTCLAYDHAAARVTGVHLRSVGGDVERQVRFGAMDLSRMDEGELRLEPPVLSPDAERTRQPIDTVRVTLPSGTSAYVRDALIERITGRILAYELALTPHGGEVVQVKPAEVKPSLQGDCWLVPAEVEARLREQQA